MPQESDAVIAMVRNNRHKEEEHCGKTFVIGKLFGREVVAVESGIGEVPMSATAAVLAYRRIGKVILHGTAGSLQDDLSMGDVVVGRSYGYTDVNAYPVFPWREIPGHSTDTLWGDPLLVEQAVDAATLYVAEAFGDEHKVTQGHVLTGGQLLNAAQIAELTEPGLVIDMESTAAAQVCKESGAPFVSIRTVSDGGESDDLIDFLGAYKNYPLGILENLLPTLS